MPHQMGHSSLVHVVVAIQAKGPELCSFRALFDYHLDISDLMAERGNSNPRYNF
jgi:hypothetical protein